MNTIISIIIGTIFYIGAMWLLLAVMRLDKGAQQDEEEDGAQAEADVARIVQASRPMPLQ